MIECRHGADIDQSSLRSERARESSQSSITHRPAEARDGLSNWAQCAADLIPTVKIAATSLRATHARTRDTPDDQKSIHHMSLTQHNAS